MTTLAETLPLAPEMRVLLDRARRRMAAGEAGTVPPTGAEPPAVADGPAIDPAVLAHLAARHGLEALLPSASTAPGSRATALEAVAGNLERIRELQRIVSVLCDADVPVVALKGPALAVQAWGDVSARSYGDVDVLVPPERAPDTVSALARAGYRDRRAAHGRTPSPTEWHDWSFTAPDGRTLVEMHWSLVSPRRHPAVRTDEAWSPGSRVEVALPGGPVPALRAELQVPYLAVHATSHHWGWLEFPLTVAALARRTGAGLDWDALLDRSRRWRVRRMVAVALILAEELVGPEAVALPDPVRSRLHDDPGARGLARWYGRQLLLDPDSEWYRGSPGLWWRSLRMRDSPGERVRAGWQYLFAPTTSEWVPPGSPDGDSRWPAPLRRVARLLHRYRTNR